MSQPNLYKTKAYRQVCIARPFLTLPECQWYLSLLGITRYVGNLVSVTILGLSTPLYICFDQPTPGLISCDIQNQQLNRLFDLHKN